MLKMISTGGSGVVRKGHVCVCVCVNIININQRFCNIFIR